MRILLSALSLLLVSSLFTGCGPKEIPIRTVYVEKECPTPKTKPIFTEYNVLILEIDGEEYYAFPKVDAIKLATNWISYREWAESNYNLIKKSNKSADSKAEESTKN